MEFGCGLHVRAPLDTPENIRAVAVRGEELGFDYLAFPDHIVMPKDYASVHPYSDKGRLPRGDEGDFLEQLTAMTYVAAVTCRMRVMASVLVVPHRPAVMTAKMLATMDVLSEGRVSVACGAGWLEEEFQALGVHRHMPSGAV
jgi:alkanesulfonate monooxygenase SsuD/methylene tetrahydromethanopterin reductase-like flavin-dependent oxidoreductase (luciferase family)